MKRLILICGLLASGFSFGADWVYVGSSDSGDKFYIDFDHYDYDKRSNAVKSWYKVDKYLNNKYYTEQKTLVENYCGSGRSKTLSAVHYHPNGGVKKTFESDYLTQSTRVFPETTGEFLYKVACDTPGKGLDFKDKSIYEIEDYHEYKRARFAYMREKMPEDTLKGFVPSLNVADYDSYSDFSHDEKKEMDKIRMRNIQKFK